MGSRGVRPMQCHYLCSLFRQASFCKQFCFNYVVYYRYFNCLCARCADPTELGSHLSSLRCPKCDWIQPLTKGVGFDVNLTNGCSSGDLLANGHTELRGIMTQVDPLKDDSPWKCPLHNFVYTRENVDKLVTNLKRHFLEIVGG